MNIVKRNTLAACGSTGLFVLLWSSGAIVSKLGLAHATPFAFLLIRFVLALLAFLLLARLLPLSGPARTGTKLYALATGLVLVGAYQIFYLLALAHDVTPGLMATLLGAQPILTAVLLERRLSPVRLLGLLLGLMGLVLVVYQGIGLSGLSWVGMLCGLVALASMTGGAIMQKGIRENPLGTLPAQYLAGLLLCAVVVPFQPFELELSAAFWLPALWMALVISVAATLLLYRLIERGNLVNVTSLFYLVPAVTAVLDYLVFGNRLAVLSLLGMALIVLGLVFVFRQQPQAASSPGD